MINSHRDEKCLDKLKIANFPKLNNIYPHIKRIFYLNYCDESLFFS